jgi:hypothetical protein
MIKKSPDSSTEAIRKNKRPAGLRKSEKHFKPKQNKIFESQKFSTPLTHVNPSGEPSPEKAKKVLNDKVEEIWHSREPLFREAFICLAAPALTTKQKTLSKVIKSRPPVLYDRELEEEEESKFTPNHMVDRVASAVSE